MQKSVRPVSAPVTEEMPNELKELVRAMESLPAAQRDALRPSVERVVECSTRRRRILNLVQDALSQLRLDMKYLIFDLEATRREKEVIAAGCVGRASRLGGCVAANRPGGCYNNPLGMFFLISRSARPS